MKIIKNGRVFFRGNFATLDIGMEEGRVSAIAPSLDGEVLYDAKDGLVLPGLVDIHTHGCDGVDFCDGNDGDLERIATFLAKNGTTSFLGTSMSLSEEILTPLFERAGRFVHLPQSGMAVMWGINMEGPYINIKKKGAQSDKYITNPDVEAFNRLYDVGFGTIRLVDIAPECEGATEFISEISGMCTVSLAHTDADYDTAAAGFFAGARHVTHLFNAMRPYHHREPALIGAAGDYAGSVEVIADGIHLDPSVVRGTFRQFEGRVCLVSDSMSATGLENGEYSLGGQKVYMKDGRCTLEDGTIAGSANTLSEYLRRAILFGVPEREAILAATLNPAKAVGIDDEVGSIEVGKRADFYITDGGYNRKVVILNGGLIDTNK